MVCSPTLASRVFSGIQPTGPIHLGNYFGAVKKWVELQNEGKKTFYSIVDLHSITMPQEPDILRKNTLEMTACLLACGIDPTKSTLFLQSQVPYHAQLSWVLSCLMSVARLDNLPQFKEKSSKLKEVPLGLFTYPILQSADILLYKATHVPVGEDQLQHLQITRHLARIFNNKFGDLFPFPNPIVGEMNSSRLKSLRSPIKKMSKSEADPTSRIELTDDADAIMKKIKNAVTDCTSKVTFEPETRLGVSNLITIHSLFSGLTPEEICKQSANIDTGQYKKVVADCLIEKISPIQKKIAEYLKDPTYLDNVLQIGAVKAEKSASKTWAEVRNRMGFKC